MPAIMRCNTQACEHWAREHNHHEYRQVVVGAAAIMLMFAACKQQASYQLQKARGLTS